jgi:hypothetical protein
VQRPALEPGEPLRPGGDPTDDRHRRRADTGVGGGRGDALEGRGDGALSRQRAPLDHRGRLAGVAARLDQPLGDPR